MKRLIFFYFLIFSFLFCVVNNFPVTNNINISPKVLTTALNFKGFPKPSYSQEGFCADTLIKTVDGYKSIQDFRIGDVVVDSNKSEKKIVSIAITLVKQYMRLVINDTVIRVGCEQQCCIIPDYVWTSVNNIKVGDCLLNHAHESCRVASVQIIRKETLLYSFTVEDHIFYIAP